MKIATWNVERLKHYKELDKICRICNQIQADILVLTETDSRIKLDYDYCYQTPLLVKSQPDYYAPTENRVSIYTNDFYEQKIVWGNLCLSAQFAFAEEGYFVNAPSPMIVPGNKYILAVLNSKLGDWYIRQLGVTRNGGYFEYKPMFVQQLPIPQILEEEQKNYIDLVDKILLSKQNGEDTYEIEQTIDEMVFALYGLTNEEIAFVNGAE